MKDSHFTQKAHCQLLLAKHQDNPLTSLQPPQRDAFFTRCLFAKPLVTKRPFKASAFVACVMSGMLLLAGCGQQPKSMFEQQAEAKAANEQAATSAAQSDASLTNDQSLQPVAELEPIPIIDSDTSDCGFVASRFDVTVHQVIAQQPNCKLPKDQCQSFELNTLAFNPEQPWLSNIMWQAIAQVLSPQTPLSGQEQTVKNTILMQFNQVEYDDQKAEHLPLYQRIDTEFARTDTLTGHHIGRMKVLSTQRQDTQNAQKQYIRYVMVDLDNQLQLNLQDVLRADVSEQTLAARFEVVAKQWLKEQGMDTNHDVQLPFFLSKQWYLDKQGLHMVYQPGELVGENSNAIDLLLPYAQMDDLLGDDFQPINPNTAKPAA